MPQSEKEKALRKQVQEMLDAANNKLDAIKNQNRDNEQLKELVANIKESYHQLESNVLDEAASVTDKNMEQRFNQIISIEEENLRIAFKNADRILAGKYVRDVKDLDGGRRRRKTRKTRKRTTRHRRGRR